MKNKPKILIVDDSEYDCNLISKFLNLKGFETTNVLSGQDCLDYLEENRCDLVLLDILMPNLTGIDVLKKIRLSSSTIDLPVVMLTIKSEDSDIIDALRLGANDYVVKPANFEVLLGRIQTHLKMKQLSEDNSKLKEKEAISAMVATYNHEINNPLAVVLGIIHSIRGKDEVSQSQIDRIQEGILKVVGIVRRIEDLSRSRAEYVEYGGGTSKIMKIKKD